MLPRRRQCADAPGLGAAREAAQPAAERRALRHADRGRSSACSSSCRWCSSCWMSLNHWPLLGAPTLNVPGQLHRHRRQPAVPRRASWFTLKYTAIVTVAAVRRRARRWRCWSRSRRRGVGLLPHGVLRAGRGRLRRGVAAVLRPATAPRSGRSTRSCAPRDPGRARSLDSARPNARAVLDDRAGGLAVRRLLHADPARSGCRRSRTRSTRRPGSTARAAGRRSARSRCRCCGRRSR